MCLQGVGRVDEEEEEEEKKRFSGLCFVGGERKLREKKKGSYRCRLFFSPLTIFWLGVKADTAVLSILAHFPLLCVCVCVCVKQPRVASLFACRGSFSLAALFTLGQTDY